MQKTYILLIIVISTELVIDHVKGVSPVPGKKVTTGYGVKGPHWVLGYHTGLDYACPVGTKVVATRDGIVRAGNWGAALGTHIIIESKDSDGKAVKHLYAHLSKKLVNVGDRVKTGQEIAKSGNTGKTTGPHLHYAERASPFNYGNHRKPRYV